MHELYVEKIDKFDVVDDIDETINKTVSSYLDISQKIDDFGLENKKCADKLGKDDLGCSDKQEDGDIGHNKVVDNPVVEPFEKTVEEENAMQDAITSNVQADLETTVVPKSPEIVVGSDKEKESDTTAIGNVSKKNVDVHSHSDEGLKTGSEKVNIEKSAEQNKDADVDTVDVDNLTSGENPIDKTSAPSIAKRLRSNSGKAIVTRGSVSVKAGKKVKNPVRYGRP
ncbi:hypothetical protein A2U01_0036564, partial [Trifolium medium]|nr:hypothetical protein [Trifolium medium]